MESLRILIVGGLGYIGTVLYETLRSRGFNNVDILDMNLYRKTPSNPFILCDIRNKEDLDKIVPRYDLIISMASIVGDPACLESTELATSVNYFGIKNLVEICAKFNKKIVHFSTCSVYGSRFNCLLKEDDEGFPIDFYGQLKQLQEKLIIGTCAKDKYLIVRLGTAYGLSPVMRYDLVVNKFIAQAVTDKRISVFGGSQERPFVHIRDVSLAVIHLISLSCTGIYNIKGENMSILRISSKIHEKIPCDVKIEPIVDMRNYNIDDTKLLTTGFTYTYNVYNAIEEISKSETASIYSMPEFSNKDLITSIRSVLELEPKMIDCAKHVDDRGTLTFCNNFEMKHVKRFYQISNFGIDVIRAFHGHLKEAKYIHVTNGTMMVVLAKLLNKSEIDKTSMKKIILSSEKPGILYVPPGYVNGFRFLTSDTSAIFYSTATLDESSSDDYRFPYDIFGTDIWDIKNR